VPPCGRVQAALLLHPPTTFFFGLPCGCSPLIRLGSGFGFGLGLGFGSGLGCSFPWEGVALSSCSRPPKHSCLNTPLAAHPLITPLSQQVSVYPPHHAVAAAPHVCSQGKRAALRSATIMLRQPLQRLYGMQASDIDIYRKVTRDKTATMVRACCLPTVPQAETLGVGEDLRREGGACGQLLMSWLLGRTSRLQLRASGPIPTLCCGTSPGCPLPWAPSANTPTGQVLGAAHTKDGRGHNARLCAATLLQPV